MASCTATSVRLSTTLVSVTSAVAAVLRIVCTSVGVPVTAWLISKKWCARSKAIVTTARPRPPSRPKNGISQIRVRTWCFSRYITPLTSPGGKRGNALSHALRPVITAAGDAGGPAGLRHLDTLRGSEPFPSVTADLLCRDTRAGLVHVYTSL